MPDPSCKMQNKNPKIDGRREEGKEEKTAAEGGNCLECEISVRLIRERCVDSEWWGLDGGGNCPASFIYNVCA